jgi:hypothetical protein
MLRDYIFLHQAFVAMCFLECVVEVMVSRVGRESTSMYLLLSQNTVPILSPTELICVAFSFFGVVI